MAQVLPPTPAALVAPLLPALPIAAVSPDPSPSVLPLLSPILRRRVQFLSDGSQDPWIRLLCWDDAKAARLRDAVANRNMLEPHPVSGEIEVDWDYDVEVRYRRLDEEVLQAQVVLHELALAFQLIHCVADKQEGGKGRDGWRVNEVSVVDAKDPFQEFGGYSTIAEAEKAHKERQTQTQATVGGMLEPPKTPGANGSKAHEEDDGDDDDGNYWLRYDNTPSRTPAASRTPATKRSPIPTSIARSPLSHNTSAKNSEDDYFSQYCDVQPALDNHDPDEAANLAQFTTTLGDFASARVVTDVTQNAAASTITEPENKHITTGPILIQPRPASSSSSDRGSSLVDRLEVSVDKQSQQEFGVAQHISRSLRSLYQLSKATGIDQNEFERIVYTELELLKMEED